MKYRRPALKQCQLIHNITKTTCNGGDAQHLWERFTTKVIDHEHSPFSLFIFYYLLNYIPQPKSFTDDQLLSWSHTSDMVRVTGIQIQLDLSGSPKSYGLLWPYQYYWSQQLFSCP